MGRTLIRWKLSEVMARHRVLAKDLASFLGISKNAVSALRKAEVMPEIGGNRWEQICAGINEFSKIGEVITPLDLIEHVPEKNSLVASAPGLGQPEPGNPQIKSTGTENRKYPRSCKGIKAA